jgi:hypothetical protein
MAWVKSDDRMDDTPKVKRAWRRNRATIGLWYMAKTYSARHESDGLVPLEWFEDKLPDSAEREEVLSVMLDVGLIEKLSAGDRKRVKISRVKRGKTVEVVVTYGPVGEESYIVHDYLEFNEARVEAEGRRCADAERKTKIRGKEPDISPSGDDDPSAGNPNGVRVESSGTPRGIRTVSTSPDPTRPDPTIEKTSSSLVEDRPEVIKLSKQLSIAIVKNDPKAKPAGESKKWLDSIRLLLDADGRTVKEVGAVIDWCQADDFWRGNILSAPKLRQKFPQLALQMQRKPTGHRESPSDLLRAMGATT